MFGLATKKDWNKWIGEANIEFNKSIVTRFKALREEMLERLEELKPKVEPPHPPEPVETNGKLWTITITRDGEPHPERYVWEDCTGYHHERYYDGKISGININFKNGATAYKVGYWNVEMTEQKAEPEVKSVGLYGIGAFQELRKYADELNHRIELLELRLNGADKQAKPKTRK